MTLRLATRILLVSLLTVPAFLTPAQPASAAPPLTTPWTDQVSQTNPLPEYPRPQLVRDNWQSLNGRWQFAGASSIDEPPVGQNLPETVLVPYPIESGLSGIQRHEDHMWYRRTFTVPDAWSGQRVRLNFGASNWRTVVWVNGTRVGSHTGAYDGFTFDITDALRAGDNELIVGVHSPLDGAGIPVGKQRRQPSGIFYTGASGIWQTVWLEPTPANHVTRLDTTPNLAEGALDLVVQGTGEGVHVEVSSRGATVATADGTPGQRIRIPIPDLHLWTPDDPFLYDLNVTVTGPGGGDTVRGYFGMRSIGKAMVGGVLRPVLNGKFVFQLGTLDQGYWPDGIYTAPTDEALRFDLEQQKDLGFNMVRKHVKVEPARWYYWADRLGLMVWQDMPSMARAPSASDRENFESELHRMIDQMRGYTSIVQWVPFNEGWGEYDPARIADQVKAWDPTRLVDNNSGSNCCGTDGGNGDVIDDHIYVGPGFPQRPTAERIATLGEFGGLGLRVEGHEWSPGNGFAYEMEPNAESLTIRYRQIMGAVRPLVNSRGLSAAIYTQPTDVENEVNGIFTYDRRVLKPDAAQVRDVNRSVLDTARGVLLRRDEPISLRSTTAGSTDRSLRHADGLAVTSPVAGSSDEVTKLDASFLVRAGLADSGCVSFESRNFPGHFLRHSGFRVRKDARDGSAGFDADATFCVRTGLGGAGTSFESYNQRGRFLRHIGSEVWIADDSGANPWDDPAHFANDASWLVTDGWWRSVVDLPVGQARSLQVVTPGHTDRYLRHQADVAVTSPVSASSDDLTKQDATFIVRRGLAEPSCYSFESRNYPGHYLRHASFRLRKDARDGSELFDLDATFCTRPGRHGSGDIALLSINIPEHYVRHIDAEAWIAGEGGPNAADNPASYGPDITWHIAPPWSPA